MKRKRITQVFPFLLPLRQKQRKFCFYTKMKWDKNRYAGEKKESWLDVKIAEVSLPLINQESGHDICYQYNKVDNLKLAAKTINHLLIQPFETFSFWQLVRYAQKKEAFKEGLTVIDGKTTYAKGGGLCQLSSLLFLLFLNSPLTIVERYGHEEKGFPTPGIPQGMDATINEGWSDLKVKNETNFTFQIEIKFTDDLIYGYLYCDICPTYQYRVVGKDLDYWQKDHNWYEQVSIYRQMIEPNTGQIKRETLLYKNLCRVSEEYKRQNSIRVDCISGIC